MTRLRLTIIVAIAIAGIMASYLWWQDQPQGRTSWTEVLSEPEQPYVRAVHWFGDGWPVNFWNTRLEDRALEDFRRIKSDGFNTVVLLVPWPGFAPDPRSGELAPDRVERLQAIIRLADDLDLSIILRTSFAWDSADQNAPERFTALWLDDAHYQGWLDYLDAIWQAVGHKSNVLFGFFSWEDLWEVMTVAGWSFEQRQQAAADSGYARWLQARYSLEALSEIHATTISAWDDVAIPQRREPAFELFLDFVNDAWINRFFLPAQRRFPRLSMEVRIDADPVWDGDELVKWYFHHAAWDLPGAQWVTIYWSPAMGGENVGEALSPETAGFRLDWFMQQLAEHAPAREIFIGQFLVEDFTPGFEHAGRIPRDQVPEFLDLASQVLNQWAAGYGLWTWADYGRNVISNPEFLSGLEGWRVNGDAATLPDAVFLPAGSMLGTPAWRYGLDPPEPPYRTEFCLWAGADGDQPAVVEVIHAGSESVLAKLEVSGPDGVGCTDLAVPTGTGLEIHALTDMTVARVSEIGFVRSSGMRDRDFELKPVGEAYRRLNAALVKPAVVRRPPDDQGWMGRHLVVHVDLEKDAQSLEIATDRPVDWPESHKLIISVDGERIGEAPCHPNGQFRFDLPARKSADRPYRVHLEALDLDQPDHGENEGRCRIRDIAFIPIS